MGKGGKGGEKKYGAKLPDGATDGSGSVGILIDSEESPKARRPSRDGGKQGQYGGYDSRHAHAASQIGKVARGGAARSKVADRYHTEGKWGGAKGEEPHHPEDFGFERYASYYDSMPEVNDDLRYCVRDITARNVLLQLGCQADQIGRQSEFEHDAFTALTNVTRERENMPAGVRKQGEMCRLFQYVEPAPPAPPPLDAKAVGLIKQKIKEAKEAPSSNGQSRIAEVQRLEKALKTNVIPEDIKLELENKAPANGSSASSSGKAGKSDLPTSPSRYPEENKHQKSAIDAINKKYLLGKYECMAVPCRADFNSAFEQIQVPAPPAPPSPAGGNSSPSKDNKGAESPPSSDCDGPNGFSGWFWVLHEGAPNIGESSQADDFPAYSREEIPEETPEGEGNVNAVFEANENMGYEGLQGGRGDERGRHPKCCWKDGRGSLNRRLDEEKYLESMFILWRLALLAFARLGVEDGLLFPFGMGAFLRHLGKNDDRYLDHSVMRQLKRQVAAGLMKAIASVYGSILEKRQPNGVNPEGAEPSVDTKKGKAADGRKKAPAPKKDSKPKPKFTPPQRLHLCLMCENAENIENHNVFMEAAGELAKEYAGIPELLLIRRNVDVFQLAHEMSASGSALKVGVLNGANRKLLGNHWFQTGARFAIDENLHRRSASLTRMALLLNMGTESGERRPTELPDTLKWLGGQVELVSGNLNDPTNEDAKSRSLGKSSSGGGGGGLFCCRKRNSSGRSSGDTSKAAASKKDDKNTSSAAQGSSQQKQEAGGSKVETEKKAKGRS